MKICSMCTWLIVVATMQFGCWTIASKAADEPSTEQPIKDPNLVPTVPVPILSPQFFQNVQEVQGRAKSVAKALAGGRPRTNVASTIHAAAEAVGAAKGDDAKAAAQKKLNDLLSKYFDED